MTFDDTQTRSENEITHWETVARTRWGGYTSDVARHMIELAHDLSPRTTSALDIGCDGGRWCRFLWELGWEVTGTEINEASLNLLKKRIPAAECILVQPEDDTIPCKSNAFDLVLCIDVVAVIQSQWFMDEIFRVMRPNGLLVGVFHNLYSFRGIFLHFKAVLLGKFDYYKIDYPSWKIKLIDKGFQIMDEVGYCWFPFPRASNSVLVPYFTRLEKALGLRKLINVSPWIAFIAQKKY
jgi:SAM-dependent methyltransferase